MKILMLGDIYGKPGRLAIAEKLDKLIKDEKIDLVIANGENTTNGRSLALRHYEFLKSHNIDVITSGNNIFKKPDPLEYIDLHDDLLRPYNMFESRGNGYKIIIKNGLKICILNLMGNTYMDFCHNVFIKMDEFLQLKIKYDILLVDFHAESTAEKKAFALNYDGIITVFAGTHTHVQTADETILPKGTAFITDLGMCGAVDSVIGSELEEIVNRAKTGINGTLINAKGNGILSGIIVEIESSSKKPILIKRVKN